MFRLPREHGFWAMLLCVLGCSLARAGASLGAVLLAALTLAALALLAGSGSRHVRRSGKLQVASSALLGLSGLPIEVYARTPSFDIATLVLAWVVVLSSSSLAVRGVFALAARQRGPAAS